MPQAKKKVPVAKKKAAAKTNKTANSLVKCEVSLDKGKWITPASCEKFHIDADAVFPTINFEIETAAAGPYDWSWEVQWVVKACPQARGKNRFKAKVDKTYKKSGSFKSSDKKWKANLGEVIGGDLVVTVKAGNETFIRRVQIFGKDPGETKVNTEIDTYSASNAKDLHIVKKIFKQESKYNHFYSDEMPLVSFDNGYGLGQATNPVPSYEQVWNWKKHVKYIIESVIAEKRRFAKSYLEGYDKEATKNEEVYDTETLVYYNGATDHYYVWDANAKKWVKNENVVCDPLQSNTGWRVTHEDNKGKTLEQLRAGQGTKPRYTGRCYAEHIKNHN